MNDIETTADVPPDYKPPPPPTDALSENDEISNENSTTIEPIEEIAPKPNETQVTIPEQDQFESLDTVNPIESPVSYEDRKDDEISTKVEETNPTPKALEDITVLTTPESQNVLPVLPPQPKKPAPRLSKKKKKRIFTKIDEDVKKDIDPDIVKDIEKDGDPGDIEDDNPQRAMWGSDIEFLMSCIATSVGLGNVWRFPFVAYQNGGGAFLIPYIIVLLLIGKPVYFLECFLGQFTSKNSVEIWAMSPAMKGTGYAQALGASYIVSYYVSIIGLCLYYLAMSFQNPLPWAICQLEWGDTCVSADPSLQMGPAPNNSVSSAELYFVKTILRQKDGIEGGLGAPLWDLTLCLLASWLIIFIIVARGVKSSGKAAYFLALFPYVIMVILLIRSTTLQGAKNGILFFLTPQWEKLLELQVWYAAVTQMFFSLSVGTGSIIMFSSYNSFKQNVYRDSMIVTTLDTFTSLISGITIFGVLGNLAYELGYDDVKDVVNAGGAGLAFISYPDAIAKSPFLPQLFAVLFFLMMSVLGVGSAVALFSSVNTVLLDAFPRAPTVLVSGCGCCVGFLVGLVFVTPAGQYILELVDYYGGTFLILFASISEIIGVAWIYGLENLCLDIEFMLGLKPSTYFRACWVLVMPVVMIVVFVYALQSYDALTFGESYRYPVAGYAAGYVILLVGVALVPIFIFISLYKHRKDEGSCKQVVRNAFRASEGWGPRHPADRRQWLQFKLDAQAHMDAQNKTAWQHACAVLTGGYRNHKN